MCTQVAQHELEFSWAEGRKHKHLRVTEELVSLVSVAVPSAVGTYLLTE